MNSIKAIYILLFFVFGCSISSVAQHTLIIPQQYEESLRGKSIETDLTFFVYPYSGEQINLIDIKRRFPDLQIDRKLTIIPPDLTEFTDVTILMAVIDQDLDEKSQLVLWLIGDYDTDEVTLFKDDFLDRDFTNDGEPIIIERSDKVNKIKVFPYGSKTRSIELDLVIPKMDIRELLRTRNIRLASFKSKMWHNFAIGIHANIGIAKLSHEYDNLDTGFPAWYDISMMEKELGLDFNYYFPKFKIGLSTSYQNIFQYTSYFNIRYGEPMIIFTGGQRVKRENVSTENNKDLHSKHRFVFDLVFGYRWHISQFVEIQPIISGGIVKYTSGEYIANKHVDPQLSFPQSTDKFIRGGVQFDFATGTYRSASFGVFYKQTWWQPVGFFESFNGENLVRNYNSVNLSISYNIGF